MSGPFSGSTAGLTDAVVGVAILALVIVRQFRARRIAHGKSWWLLPAVLVLLSLRHGGWVDPRHESVSVLLLAAEMVIGICLGATWALTMRIWRDESGQAWAKGTRTTAVIWTTGIAVRIGLGALGAMAGVRESSGGIMLALAVTLLIRTGVLVRRAAELEPGPLTAPIAS